MALWKTPHATRHGETKMSSGWMIYMLPCLLGPAFQFLSETISEQRREGRPRPMDKCNVRIADKHFHEMHHALGNPWPDEIAGETYRNYFATDADSDTAARMRASSHWTNGSDKFGMTYFHVTDEGKRALLKFMRENVAMPARYAVTFHHHDECRIVPAKSRSAARYAVYRDADVDWPFMEYAANIRSIRLFAPANVPAPSREPKA